MQYWTISIKPLVEEIAEKNTLTEIDLSRNPYEKDQSGIIINIHSFDMLN